MPTTELTDPRQDPEVHLRRLLSDLPSILEEDPQRALSRARRAAKWVLGHLHSATEKSAPAGLTYGDLLERLVRSGRLPRRIQVQFHAIESFGTEEDHSDSGLTRSDVMPCLQALDTIVGWYLSDVLSSKDETPVLPHGTAGTATSARHVRRRRTPAWRRLARRAHPTPWRILDALLCFAVLALFGLQLEETRIASGRLLGIILEELEAGVVITDLQAGGPAARDGLKKGDVLVAVEDYPIERIGDYDVPAASFVRGEPVAFRVSREGQILDLAVVPGAPPNWTSPAIRGFVMLCCLVLGAYTLYRSTGDLRGRLLSFLLFLLAIELAWPDLLIGEVWLEVALAAFSYLHTGAQIAVELHLAAMIPVRQSWLARRGWIVPLSYVLCLGWAVAAVTTYLMEISAGSRGLPWSVQLFDDFMSYVGLPVWATATVLLLGIPAWRYPERSGRLQARAVMLGFLPWSIYTYLVWVLTLRGASLPAWTDLLFPFLLLPFPFSIWAMMELESRRHRRILLTLSRRIRECETVEEISRRIAADLGRALLPAGIYVFFCKTHDDELTLGYSGELEGSAGLPPALPRLSRVAGESDEALVYPEDLEGLLSEEETHWLRDLGARVILPLNSRRSLTGLVILGPKRSEAEYSDRDFKLLHSLGEQIALSLENLDLQSQLHREKKVQRDVLARLQQQDINLVKECPQCGACYDNVAEHCDRQTCRPRDAGPGVELALLVPVERTIRERYRLDRVLGKGGIGSVYQALDLRLNRRVAVKVLLGSVLDKPHVVLRFEREARVIAQLDHPNIITLHDYGQTSVGNAFIVLELLRGTSLRSVFERSGAIAPADVVRWLEPMLAGLEAAHRKGVVHRDLKPGNVLIARDSRGGERVKLLDFGIAKIRSDEPETQGLTLPGAVLGTLGYMAPEQIFGGDIDERTDIYSLGVVVTEALLGRRPFKGRTPVEVLASVAAGSLDLPRGTPAEIELFRILKRCLEPEALERWSSVAELRDALIPALRAMPRPDRSADPDDGGDDVTWLRDPSGSRGENRPIESVDEPTEEL